MLERRACQRFSIPGAAVTYKIPSLFRRNQPFTNTLYPVVDLSRGGLSFLHNTPLKENKKISLLLHISEKEAPLLLEGKIIYVLLNQGGSYRYRIGIRFNPFGIKEGFNKLDALKRLEDLEKIFLANKTE